MTVVPCGSERLELDLVGHLADKLQAEAAKPLGTVEVGRGEPTSRTSLKGKPDAFVFNDNDDFVGMIFQNDDKTAIFQAFEHGERHWCKARRQ